MAESISCTVLVENIAYACSVPEIERELKSIAAGLQILSISAMKGKAKVELPSLSIADTFMQRVRGHRLQNRALRAELIPTSASSHTYVQADLPEKKAPAVAGFYCGAPRKARGTPAGDQTGTLASQHPVFWLI